MDRLYILVDKSLDPVYAPVQGGHCVAQWLLDHPGQQWNNQTLVYLKCDIEKEFAHLKSDNEDFSFFIEPDLGNKLTSLAINGNRQQFKKLRLLT